MRVVKATLRPLYTRERPGTHCARGWVGPRAGLDRCGKSRPPTGIRSPDRLARSQTLYRLGYRAHTRVLTCSKFETTTIQNVCRPQVPSCLGLRYTHGNVLDGSQFFLTRNSTRFIEVYFFFRRKSLLALILCHINSPCTLMSCF